MKFAPLLLAALLGASTYAVASTAADTLKQANDKMMMQMNTVTMTGDTDKDFVAMMIPHHQGAIDMARIELEYGTDPEVRKLAEAVIKAQEAEIAMMREWLKTHDTAK